MGIDIEKIKVKKDHKDAKIKAQQLFKKATNAITFSNRINKNVNEKIASLTEMDNNIIDDTNEENNIINKTNMKSPSNALQKKASTGAIVNGKNPSIRP